MADERSVTIQLCDKSYDLLLTLYATKKIAKRFGGLENLGSKLVGADFEKSIEDIVWLITLLANQSVMIYNLKNKQSPQELLTEEEVEMFSSPADMIQYKDALMDALTLGVHREVVSEPTKDLNPNESAG
jgi:hypothetical protein